MSTQSQENLDDRRKVWSLRDLGWTQVRIAHELGLHPSTISRTLRRPRPAQPVKPPSALGDSIMQQARQLAHIVDEALDAWERSKHSQIIRKVSKKSNSGKGEPVVEVKEETTEKEQAGTAGYLSQARYAMTELRRLWEESGEQEGESTALIDPRIAEAAIQAALAVEQKLIKKQQPEPSRSRTDRK